jgi:hypothetical protein
LQTDESRTIVDRGNQVLRVVLRTKVLLSAMIFADGVA